MHRHKSKKSSHKKKFRQFFDSHRILKCICIVFAVVAILYFLYRYAYIGMMLRFMAITGAFELDGNIYRNPYGDFVLILFPILIYIVNALKNKKNDPLLWNMATMVGFSFWLIRYVLYGLVGSYYFYKMHFIIWILAWAMVYKVVISLKKDGLYYAGVYGLMVLMLLGVHVSGMEKKNNEYNYFFWPTQLTNEFFGIYDYNIRLMKEGGTLDQELLDAAREILTIREKEASYVPIFGDEVKYYKDYFYVFSGQDRYAHPHWLFDENAVSDDIVQSLREIGAGYVCVKNDYFVEEGIYADDFIYWENVWSNSGYVIYKVPA